MEMLTDTTVADILISLQGLDGSGSQQKGLFSLSRVSSAETLDKLQMQASQDVSDNEEEADIDHELLRKNRYQLLKTLKVQAQYTFPPCYLLIPYSRLWFHQ